MMTRSKRFIESYYKVLHNGCEFYNRDAGLMTSDDFKSSDVKWLIVFPSSSFDKDNSMTPTVLLDFVRSSCPGVFIDFAFLPCRDDIRWYDKESMPYAIGVSSHLDASHFDIVGFSISCLYEIPVVPWMLQSFSRCDKPIPLSWSERRKYNIDELPVIYAGGASVVYSDILFGDLGDGRKSYLDFMHLGQVWSQTRLLQLMLNKKYKNPIRIGRVPYLLWERGDRHCYMPQAYDIVFDGCRVVSVTPSSSSVPSSVVFNTGQEKPSGLLGASRGYLRGSGGNAGLAMVSAAEGCGFAGNCTFCAEGHIAGGLHEESQDDIVRMARAAKISSGADTVKLASYNLNYLTDWKGTVARVQDVFPTVSFSNMRMEELGRDEDAMELLFQLGFRRGTAPIEGISPRIRNGYYNKGLSEEALDSYMRFMVHRGCLDIKVGIVLCGLEEGADWQWLYDFTKRWKDYAASRGGKLPIRYRCTPLVQYPLTPMEYTAKSAARISYEDGEWVPRYWFDKFAAELDTRIQVNGYRYSTLLEQVFVSLGRKMTSSLQSVLSSGHFLYNMRALTTSSFMDDIRSVISADAASFFEMPDIDSYVSILSAVSSPFSEVCKLQGRNIQSGLSALPMSRCLRTNAVDRLTCYEKISGGCTGCVGKAASLRPFNRQLLSSVTSKDILAVVKPETVQTLRFRIKRYGYATVLNPRHTAHILASALMQHSEVSAASFIRVSKIHSMYGQSYADSHWDVSGSQLVDLEFRTLLSTDVVNAAIASANSILQSFTIMGFSDGSLDSGIELTDMNVFTFRSDLPLEVWDFVLPEYDGSVMVLEGDKYYPRLLKSGPLSAPVVGGASGGSKGVFVLPVRCNPWYYLRAVLRPKRVHPNKLYRDTFIDCVTTVRVRDYAACSGCGSSNAVYDIGSGKPYNFCTSCLAKLLLKKL